MNYLINLNFKYRNFGKSHFKLHERNATIPQIQEIENIQLRRDGVQRINVHHLQNHENPPVGSNNQNNQINID